MIICVEYDLLYVLEFDSHSDNITCDQVIAKLHNDHHTIPDNLTFHANGQILNQCDSIEDGIYIYACYVNAIVGGKGGFGAALRSKAKQKGIKVTTDFGACRDLNGRRLRHVNDEIILKKFNEAKERGEKMAVDEETPTGIDMWYLSKPSWADTVKQSSRGKHMKKVGKTELCRDWVKAHESGKVPVDAPVHWGCPRGNRCTFAHGVDDLRGESKTEVITTQKRENRSKDDMRRQEYVQSAMLGGDNDAHEDDLMRAVSHGLKNAANYKMAIPVAGNDTSSNDKGVAEEKNQDFNDMLPFDDYGF